MKPAKKSPPVPLPRSLHVEGKTYESQVVLLIPVKDNNIDSMRKGPISLLCGKLSSTYLFTQKKVRNIHVSRHQTQRFAL